LKRISVKICGLKTEKDVKLCQESGADMIGFVTEYPIPVPWNLSRNEAAELLKYVQMPCKSCLVTGGIPEKTISLAKELRPDFIQLHYNETFEETIEIAEELKPLNIEIIKTFPLSDHDRIRQFGTANMERIVKLLCETEIFGILVDSRSPSNAAGKGETADFEVFKEVKALSSKHVILGGGITPDNIRKIVEETNAEFVDVMTGVEQSLGIKDENKIKNLMAPVRQSVARVSKLSKMPASQNY